MKKLLRDNNVATADVPKNLTHLLSPLDLTVNKSIKVIERQEFSSYFTKTVTDALKKDPSLDVADIKLDTRTVVMRPLHARSLCKIHSFFETPRGQLITANGWKAAGITDAVKDARATVEDCVDQFAAMTI